MSWFNRKSAEAASRADRYKVSEFSTSLVLNQTNIAKSARDLGKKNLPNLNDPISKEENEAIEICQNYLDSESENIAGTMNFSELSISSDNFNEHFDQIDTIAHESKHSIEELKREHVDGLSNLYESQQRSLRDLRSFKAENELSREASYSDGLGKWWFFFVIFLIEFFLNAYQLAAVSQGGLIQGLITSFVTASLLIVFGFTFGSFWRYYKYKPWGMLKGFLPIAHIIFLAIILFTVIYAGMNRVILEQEAYSAGDSRFLWSNIAAKIVDDPFGMIGQISEVPEALILFIVGIIIAVVSMFKGYKWSDVYPGYANVDRKFTKARKKYQTEKNNFLGLAQKASEKSYSQLDTQKEAVQNIRKQAILINKNVENVFSNLSRIKDSTNSVLESVLKTFRDQNKSVRTDEVIPTYFKSYPKLNTVHDFNKGDYLVNLNNVNSEVTSILNKHKETKSAIQESYRKEIDTIENYFSEITKNTDEKIKEELVLESK